MCDDSAEDHTEARGWNAANGECEKDGLVVDVKGGNQVICDPELNARDDEIKAGGTKWGVEENFIRKQHLDCFSKAEFLFFLT